MKKDTFIKVAAVTSDVVLGDVSANVKSIEQKIDEAISNHAKVICFQELCITGYSLMDIFFLKSVVSSAMDGLIELKHYSENKDAIITVSLPLRFKSKDYEAAAVLFDGHILGIQLKTYLPNYEEFHDARYFAPSFDGNDHIAIDGEVVPVGNKLLFECENVADLVIGVEICEDVWTPVTVSTAHCLNGATLILNPSGSNELVGKAEYRSLLVKATSGRLICGYVYANCGFGESTTDVCYSGHNIIAENGSVLAEKNDFNNHIIYADVALSSLVFRRAKMTTFIMQNDKDYITVPFCFKDTTVFLERKFPMNPFISTDEKKKNIDLDKIMNIQVGGLLTRIRKIGIKDVVIGVSGGLDSALALLICYMTFKKAGLDTKGIHAISMPCFATTSRTKNNAKTISDLLNTDFLEIDISRTVLDHLKDIDHATDVYDIAFENAQARERTQVLMDRSNQVNGIVIGTGDLSELALGWATYNGDQMSMYNVNCSVPKTVIKEEIRHIASTLGEQIEKVILDILDTPISPELVPNKKEDKIIQVTEDKVGAYILNDFFLYHFLRNGYDASTIYELAKMSFEGVYDEEYIRKILYSFFRRFTMNQFKRSAMPDGVKVGSVCLTPRGDLKMPSDMSYADFVKSL